MTGVVPADVAAMGPWFYDYALPGGVRTNPDLPETLRVIHETRREMLGRAVAGLSGVLPAQARCLDLGCHQGYFSFALREMVRGPIVGVDVRAEHVRNAAHVAGALGLDDLSFERLDAERLDERFGSEPVFDLTVCFGLVYHLENPIGVLRRAAAVTRHALVLETQLVDDIDESVEWGRRGQTFDSSGRFVLVDESGVHATNKETGGTPLALCPSERALRTVLARVGFGRFERVEPGPGAHEQFERGRRAVFVARRTDAGAEGPPA